MQNLRKLGPGTKLEMVRTTHPNVDKLPGNDLTRSIQSVKPLIHSLMLMIEAAEESLTNSFSSSQDFYENVSRFEINMINRALRLTEGNQRKAAKILGIKATTLNSKIKKFGVGKFIPSEF